MRFTPYRYGTCPKCQRRRRVQQLLKTYEWTWWRCWAGHLWVIENSTLEKMDALTLRIIRPALMAAIEGPNPFFATLSQR